MKLNVPLMGQRDSRWASKKLGTSTTSTIGDYGCAVACVAMMCAYYGKATDVGKLNDDLKQNNINGFDGSYIIWQNVKNLYPDIIFTKWEDYPLTPAPVDRINAQLNTGKPVIVWVDINPNQPGNQMHFVILIGIEGNDYYCNDPWYNDQILFSTRYGDPVKGLLGHRFYSGPVPSQPEKPPVELEECLKQHTLLVDQCNEKDRKIQDLSEQLQNANTKLKENANELTGLRNSLIGYQDDFKELADILSSPDNKVLADMNSISGAIEKLKDQEDALRDERKKNDELQEAVNTSNNLYQELDEKYQQSLKDNSAVSKALQEARGNVTTITKQLDTCNNKLEKCEKQKKYERIIGLLGFVLCKEV